MFGKKKGEPIHLVNNRFGKWVGEKVQHKIDERKAENAIYKKEYQKAKMQGLRIRARKEGRDVGLGKKQTGLRAFMQVPPKYGTKGKERSNYDAVGALLGPAPKPQQTKATSVQPHVYYGFGYGLPAPTKPIVKKKKHKGKTIVIKL